MNFKDAIKRINKDFCNLFQAKYLKGLWGYNVGFKTVPAYIAIMRKQLADWQEANDCSNSLCTESKLQLQARTCPPGYFYVGPGIIATKPNGACVINNVTPPIDPINPIITVISYGKLADPCTCILNPPLAPFGPGCCHWGRLNVNEILIAGFTR